VVIFIPRAGGGPVSGRQLERAVKALLHPLVPALERLPLAAEGGIVELAAAVPFGKGLELAGEPAVGVEVVGH
jgi:hypothetical protein